MRQVGGARTLEAQRSGPSAPPREGRIYERRAFDLPGYATNVCKELIQTEPVAYREDDIF